MESRPPILRPALLCGHCSLVETTRPIEHAEKIPVVYGQIPQSGRTEPCSAFRRPNCTIQNTKCTSLYRVTVTAEKAKMLELREEFPQRWNGELLN